MFVFTWMPSEFQNKTRPSFNPVRQLLQQPQRNISEPFHSNNFWSTIYTHTHTHIGGNILICIYFNAPTPLCYNPLQKRQDVCRPIHSNPVADAPAADAAGNSFELMVKWFSDILLMLHKRRLELCTNFRRLTWDKTPPTQANSQRTRTHKRSYTHTHTHSP